MTSTTASTPIFGHKATQAQIRHSASLHIFLSYASEQRSVAEEIALALKERGHIVFFDRDHLPPGRGFHAKIKREAEKSDLIVFLISPDSIKSGSYTLTELGYARRRFAHPAGRVLPVVVAPTPLEQIPTYLRAVTLLEPQGNLAAEVASAVDHLSPRADGQDATSEIPHNRIEVLRHALGSSALSVARQYLNGALNRYGWVAGLILVLAANVLNYAGSEKTILWIIYDHLGFNFLQDFDMFVRPATVIGLVTGYLLCFGWSCQRLPFKLYWGRLMCLAALLFIACAANIKYGLPHRPVLQEILDNRFSDELYQWAERAFTYQDSVTGGIRSAPDNKSHPSAWPTAQVIVGVIKGIQVNSDLIRFATQLRSAFKYLEQVMSIDPQTGWGYYDKSAQTVTEITSWATLAYILSLEPHVKSLVWADDDIPRVKSLITENLKTIAERQSTLGGWMPIAGTLDEENTRTYSTIMSLWVLLEATRSSLLTEEIRAPYATKIRNCIMWLLYNYNQSYAWVPNPHRDMQTELFIGLTAQVLFILHDATTDYPFIREHPVYLSGKTWFLNRDADFVEKNLEGNRRTHDADVHLFGLQFTLEQSTFLWYPWSYAVLSTFASDKNLPDVEREAARASKLDMSLRFGEFNLYLNREFPYVLAENLYAISIGLQSSSR